MSTPAEPAREADLGLLEREGDIAADYLEGLLDIADLDGDIDIDVEGNRAAVSIVGADLSSLVGPEGATLEALQELTRLAVHRETGVRSRLMLDIGGHRARRREQLTRLAVQTAEKVRDAGEPARLDCHDTVRAQGGARRCRDGRRRGQRVGGRGAGAPGRHLPPRDPRGAGRRRSRWRPAAACPTVAVSGSALAQAVAFARLLAPPGSSAACSARARPRGCGSRHLLNSAAVIGLRSPAGRGWSDVGSGAGLPGWPWPSPDLTCRCISSSRWHAASAFLHEAVDRLGLGDRVRVHQARAEDLHGRLVVDVVTARAVAPLVRLVPAVAPLAPGGRLVAMKGRSAADEIAAASTPLATWGRSGARVIELSAPG